MVPGALPPSQPSPSRGEARPDGCTSLRTAWRCCKAARDYHPGRGKLTRTPGSEGIYSRTGIFGDATLATLEKGRVVVEAKVAGILADIARLRAAALPCL